MSAKILMRKITIDIPKIKRVTEEAFTKAQIQTAIQWLGWINNGSPSEPATPPIRWGVLRASSSAFVGAKLIGTQKQSISVGAKELPDPAKSYTGKKGVITVVYNVKYAFKMHEERYKTWIILGSASERAKAGEKWLEKHVAKDGKDLYDHIARIVKKILRGAPQIV